VDEHDELQGLWQSQPVNAGGAPRFGLVEDLTAPVSYPMSRAVRWSNAAGLLLMSSNAWRDMRPGITPFELTTAQVAFAACMGGAIILLLPLGGQPQQLPPADATVAEYRTAMAREYIRQSSVERRVYLPALGIVWAAILTHAFAQMVRTGFHWYHLTVLGLFAAFVAVTAWYMRDIRRRAVRRIISGL
jgi:hypothetical protein